MPNNEPIDVKVLRTDNVTIITGTTPEGENFLVADLLNGAQISMHSRIVKPFYHEGDFPLIWENAKLTVDGELISA